MREDDVPKYRKRAKKSTPKKADHEHQDAYCVFEYSDSVRPHLLSLTIGQYCPICGKIRTAFVQDDKYTTTTNLYKYGVAFGKEWNAEAKKEFDMKTRTLPTFKLKNVWNQKYIEVNK